MQLESLHIYAVKSAAGINAARWPVDEFRTVPRRRFVVVDEGGMFRTQRHHPRLALLRTTLGDAAITLAAPGMQPLSLPLDPAGGRAALVTVWNDTCEARLCEHAADDWLSRFLGVPSRLAYMPATTLRPLDPERAPPGRRVSFADAYPFLLIGAASLMDLNRRLAAALPMNRFRPNLVIAGSAPYAEDSWHRIRIGTLEFDVVKPCARCVITTTDQDTAERGVEPLRTLGQYRRFGDDVWFGQNLVHHGTGELRVGDPVTVLA
ncbi:MAG: MOSC domain-containing protein [Planctomycetota bacterium]